MLIYIFVILPCSCFEDKPVRYILAVSPTGLKVTYLESSYSPDSKYGKKWSGTINILIYLIFWFLSSLGKPGKRKYYILLIFLYISFNNPHNVWAISALSEMIPLSMFEFKNLPCLFILPLLLLLLPDPSWNLSKRGIRQCFERFHGLLFYWL